MAVEPSQELLMASAFVANLVQKGSKCLDEMTFLFMDKGFMEATAALSQLMGMRNRYSP